MNRRNDILKNNKKFNKAVALTYDSAQHYAPTVKAKGKGFVADKIIEAAKQNGIAIQEDESLVELLSQLDINTQIPEELFQVVAEILANVYRLEKKVGSQ